MPAKTPRRHRQGVESRQRILESALAIAAERGYDGTTVALITDRAMVPASSVYWQFANKDELLAEALDYSYRSWRRDGPTWQPGNYTGTMRDRIVTRLDNSRRAVEEKPDYWRLGLMVALLKRTGKIAAQDRFLAVRAETRLIIDEWWRTMLPAEAGEQPELIRTLTQSYLALVDGLFVAHSAEPDMDLEAQTTLLADAMADVVATWFADPELALPKPGATRSPRTAEHSANGEDDSRTRLLVAAEEIAAECGYRGTTISKICKHAGLPASSVYWHFEGKSSLMAEVVQHSWDEWVSSQPSWEDPGAGQTWGEALRNILVVSAQSLSSAPSFMRIGHMLALEHSSEDVPARTSFIAIRTGTEEHIAEWFSRNLPSPATKQNPELPMLLSRSVMAFTDGYFLSTQIDDTQAPVANFVEFVVDVLEQAARPKGRGRSKARP
jgi:AcrR family transcriptional regulator